MKVCVQVVIGKGDDETMIVKMFDFPMVPSCKFTIEESVGHLLFDPDNEACGFEHDTNILLTELDSVLGDEDCRVHLSCVPMPEWNLEICLENGWKEV